MNTPALDRKRTLSSRSSQRNHERVIDGPDTTYRSVSEPPGSS